MGGKREETIKRANKTCKAISQVFLVVVVLALSNWAFAQGGSIIGSVKDLKHQGIEGLPSVTDASTGALAGTTTTDASGNYSVDIQSLGDYTLWPQNPDIICQRRK
jgi:hypothetical protein